jgi:hypothetical protein
VLPLRELQLRFAAQLAAGEVDVYRESMTASLVRALGDVHRVCRQLTGERFFDQCALAYVARTPSISGDLRDYGAGFGDFLESFTPARQLPYLADTARLEWHWHRAFHAPAPPSFPFTSLAELPETELVKVVFALPPGAALLASPHPVNRIWEAHQQEMKESLDLDAGGPAQLIVWREGLVVRIDPVEDGDWQALQAFAAHRPLGELSPDLVEMRLAALVQRGWVTSFSFQPTLDGVT